MPDETNPPPSEPATDAVQAGEPLPTQSAAPRQIDENTDLKTLTDEEIKQLNEMAEQSAMKIQDERVS